ncbi:MAG: glycosyltransferase [Chloroflexota bacterium]
MVFLLQVLYTIGVLGLAIYGFNALWLTWKLHQKYSQSLSQTPKTSPTAPSIWPLVTVQLPIYNERHVATRLIDACTALNYPKDKLEIQILDDSTDQTQAIIQRHVSYWQQQGYAIEVFHRTNRKGYKAGALAHALPYAKGDYIALFDADFEPHPSFLHQVIPHFIAHEQESNKQDSNKQGNNKQGNNKKIAFVQTRWAHLNRYYSWLTKSQALALDGHFVVEQAARQAAGYPFGFNGSAGVWSRACLEDACVGGWHDDTLCEDLDLSYRAQLMGWEPLYINEIEVPAEIPPQLTAFKRQQFRWAKGSIQTLRKLGGRVSRSDWPLPAKLSGLFHLGSYLIHPLLLLLILTLLPLILMDVNPAGVLALLSLTSIGPPLLYAVAQKRLHPDQWFNHWKYLPSLMLLGTGVCLNNTVAVCQGFFQKGGNFLRTPKFHVTTKQDVWYHSMYSLPFDLISVGEFGLMLYALTTTVVAIYQEQWWSVPFMLLYTCSFGLMTWTGLWQGWQSAVHRRKYEISLKNDELSTAS